MKARICIVSLSLPFETNPRLIQQVQSLAPCYTLTVIGYGDAESFCDSVDGCKIVALSEAPQRIVERFLHLLGKLHPLFLRFEYWEQPQHKQALMYAQESQAEAFLAQGWDALPLTVRASRKKPIVFDAGDDWADSEPATPSRQSNAPLDRWMARKYLQFVSSILTLSSQQAQGLNTKHGIRSTLIESVAAVEELVPIFQRLIRSAEWTAYYELPSAEDYLFWELK